MEVKQARHQEFFREGEFFWNKDASINNHLQHEKESCRSEKSPVFSPPKIRELFSNFRKSAGENSSLPPLVMRL